PEKTRTDRFDRDWRIVSRRLRWENWRLIRPLGEKTKRAAAPISAETTPEAPTTTIISPQCIAECRATAAAAERHQKRTKRAGPMRRATGAPKATIQKALKTRCSQLPCNNE